MSRGKKDREEITNTEEVKETEVSDEMEKAEDSEKAEDDKKPEETKETDDKPVSLYVQEPFIDPSVYRQRRKKRIIRTVTIAVVDRKSTRLNSSHANESRMPSSA